MNNLKFVTVLLLTFSFLPSSISAEETTSQLSTQEIENIAQMMRAVEDTLLNVRIDSNSWVEQGPSSSGPWERTPVCFSTTAFFGQISSSRARIDFHKSVLEWKDGAAPYLEKSYSVSFDGEQGRRKEISSSYNEMTFARDTGAILSEANYELTSYGRITGIEASFFFHRRGMPEPFSKRFSTDFEAVADPNAYLSALAAVDSKYLNVKPCKVEVVFDELRGMQCIKVASIGDPLLQQWWFAPNRGFALLRFDDLRKDQDRNEQVNSSINVTKLEEVAEDIWWPMEAYFVESPREAGKPWKRIVYQASKVVANDPNFDDSVFTIDFPTGYKVNDEITGTNYVVGQEQ